VPSKPQNLLTSSHIPRSLPTDCIPIGFNARSRIDKVAIIQNHSRRAERAIDTYINSDFESTVATSTTFVNRRGECNIPKRYLKDAEWHKDTYLGIGYYCSDPDS
jgi:hypothetical protein